MFKESETIEFKKSTAESTTVEWKQSVAEIDEIIETAAAFANTEGGRIFIGISPEGHDYLDMKILEGTIPELREKA